MRTGAKHAFPYIDVLGRDTLEKARQGVLDVLAKTGVTVKDAAMRKTMRAYGCRVDDSLERVYADAAVVERALADSPGGFTVKARDAQDDVALMPGEGTVFLNACGTRLLDATTGEFYEPTRMEFYNYLRLLDALPNVDIQNCFPLFGFQNVPECMRLLESSAAKYRVSTKVQIEGTVFDNYIFHTKMVQAVGHEMCQIVNSAAPLTYFEETANQIRNYAQAGLPFHFAAGPTRGMTSPMSAVGSVILNNAEAMAGIIMAQAVKPGSRVWANSMIMTPNMQTGTPAFGDIGNSITDMVFNQMWRDFGIPCWSNAASWTSSKEIDYQAGYELLTALMAQAMSGATAISFQAGLYAELSVYAAKAVIDDDIVGMVKRLMRGPDTSDKAFAAELIEETGPMPGSYMHSDMTLENWREECYIPTVASREPHADWLRNGKHSILDNARQKTEELLAAHQTARLSDEQEAALEAVLREARAYYREKDILTDAEWALYQQDLDSPGYPFA